MISRETVQTLLGPHHDQLLGCVTSAWERWTRDVRPLYPLPHPTVRANVVWGFMTDEARTRFGDVQGVRILDRPERFLLGFGPSVVVRFKKVDSEFRTSNYPTRTAARVDAQQLVPGAAKKASILTVGYQVDRAGQQLIGVDVVYTVHKALQWEYSLLDPSRGPVAQLTLAHTDRNTPRVRVRPGVQPLRARTTQEKKK